MDRIRTGMIGVAALIIVTGLAWIGHGTGLVRLPATSFMTELSVWTINGALVVAFGLIVLLGAWRLLRDHPHAPSDYAEPEDGQIPG
jgi:heme A synthase